MSTLTIRNVPDDMAERLKSAAAEKHHSMEQEVRELLQARYAPRDEVLGRIRRRWEELPETTAEEIARWRRESRPGE